MTSAAVKTAVNVGATIGSGAAISSTGLVEGIYTTNIVTTKDWLSLTDFDEIIYAWGYITATGVDAVVYVDSTTKNKLFVTGTGAITVHVKGTKAIAD